MSSRPPQFAFVASTSGSVMNQVLANPFFRQHTRAVIVDRPCPAMAKAERHGVHCKRLFEADTASFCDKLHGYLLEHGIDYVFTYYTKFYTQSLRDAFQDRIINFHPSLLPAFKGMDGFGDTVSYHAKFVGNTVEFIDQVMDEGKIIMQTVTPLDVNVPLNVVRHRVFVQQCKAILQVAKWLAQQRVVVDGRRVEILGASYDHESFSPSLDFEDAVRLTVPMPEGLVVSAVTT